MLASEQCVAHAHDQHLLHSYSKAIQTIISFPGLLVLLYSLPSMHYPAKTLSRRGETNFFLKGKTTPILFGFSSLFSGPRVLCSNFRLRGCGFIWHQMHNFWAWWKRATFWQLCACLLYCELFAWQEKFLFVEATDLRFLLKSVWFWVADVGSFHTGDRNV